MPAMMAASAGARRPAPVHLPRSAMCRVSSPVPYCGTPVPPRSLRGPGTQLRGTTGEHWVKLQQPEHPVLLLLSTDVHYGMPVLSVPAFCTCGVQDRPSFSTGFAVRIAVTRFACGCI